MTNLTPNPPWVRRRSLVFDTPTLDANNRPVNWQPASVTNEAWGRIRVIVDDTDLTFIRDVPVEIRGWASNEPFGDAVAHVAFPMLTPFDSIEDFIAPFARVKFQRVTPEGLATDVLFSGFAVDYTHESTETDFLIVVELLGSFYELDLRLTAPQFIKQVSDIGHQIAESFNFQRTILQSPLGPMNTPTTGVVGWNNTAYEKWASEYYQGLLSRLRLRNGDQWTILCQDDQPELVLKDRETVHWTIHAGQPGAIVRVHHDLLQPNVVFGEGINSSRCLWRNTKYPNLRATPPPSWPDIYLGVGTIDPAVLVWKEEMYLHGWRDLLDPGFTFTARDSEATKDFQERAGVQIDGIVGPQTWTATFQQGDNAGDPGGVFVDSLASDIRVEPVTRSASGGVTGWNPKYDPAIPRIEQFVNFGQNALRSVAIEDAKRMVREWDEPGWYGSIELHADPQEGSRLEIRAGQNILVKDFHGEDTMFHIAQSRVDVGSMSVSLQVDTNARDLMTLTAMDQRDAEAKTHPWASRRLGRRTTSHVEDQFPLWDCESGAGVIPRMGQQAGLWNIVRVPAAEFGQVVQVEFVTHDPCEFAVAIFDRYHPASTLQGWGAPTDTNFWKHMPGEWGLLVGWGGEGEMGGYWPGRQSGNDPKTGWLVDKSAWYFQSTQPPWLWVAVWTEITTHIKGRLYPGPLDLGSLPIIPAPPPPAGAQ